LKAVSPVNINEKIKARRLELELTLEDVGNALGVSKSTVLKYETEAIKNMGIDKVEALAKVLKVAPSYLMGWSDLPAPADEISAKRMIDTEGKELVDTINQLTPENRKLAVELLKRLAGRE
jgi:transcriptional regulator with XRE-family HTH domain